MKIELFHLETEKNVLNKIMGEDYSSVITYNNGYILPNSDISSPIIRIANINDLDEKEIMINANYCKIEDLKRYYFIDKMVSISDDVIDLYLSVDVLESFKSDILQSRCYILRNENEYNELLVDSEVIKRCDTNYNKIVLSNDLFDTTLTSDYNNQNRYILTIMTTEVGE